MNCQTQALLPWCLLAFPGTCKYLPSVLMHVSVIFCFCPPEEAQNSFQFGFSLLLVWEIFIQETEEKKIPRITKWLWKPTFSSSTFPYFRITKRRALFCFKWTVAFIFPYKPLTFLFQMGITDRWLTFSTLSLIKGSAISSSQFILNVTPWYFCI